MSELLISRSEDLRKLREEGFTVRVIQRRTLCIDHVPYRTSEGKVARGTLLSALETANDKTVRPTQHVVRFSGEMPHDSNGRPLAIANSVGSETIDGVEVHFSFSRKPRDSGQYDDYYDKMTTYVALLEGPASLLDPSVRSRMFQAAPPLDEDSVFVYADTASPRAGIAEVSRTLDSQQVAIIGLGGSGSYVLDMVAKTGVREIHLFDGDRFIQHNAFRAPGAHRGSEFEGAPSKVSYLASLYSQLRKGIIPHPYYVDAPTVNELRGFSFVFVAVDSGSARLLITSKLQEFGVPFVDVGMGLALEDGRIDGILRLTTMTSRKQNHFRPNYCVPYADRDGDDIYSTNIQVAELNAVLASLAVIKWKKLVGFYRDNVDEHHSTLTLEGNVLASREFP